MKRFLIPMLALMAMIGRAVGADGLVFEHALYVPFVADDQIARVDGARIAYGAYGYWEVENGRVMGPGVVVSAPLRVCNVDVDWTKLAWDGTGDVVFSVRGTVDNGEGRGVPDEGWTAWAALDGDLHIPDALDGKPFLQFKMQLSDGAEVREVRIYRRTVIPDHPRMWTNRREIARVREAIRNDPFKRDLFVQFKGYIDAHVLGQKEQRERGVWHVGWIGSALGMLYQLTGDVRYAEEAKLQLMRLRGPVAVAGDTVAALDHSQQREFDYSELARDLPMVYDLIAETLTQDERLIIGKELERLADFVASRTRRYRFPDLCNQVYVKNVTAMMVGIGLFGDGVCDEKAERWLIYADRNLHERLIPASNFWAADDGGWGEGPGYALFTGSRFAQEMLAWQNTTGEHLFEISNFFRYLTQWQLWITRPHNGRTVKFNDSAGRPPDVVYPNLLASLYGDGRAQTFANRAIEKAKSEPDGWANMSLWRSILFCDSSIQAEPLVYAEQPSARHFEGVGQVVFRSGWDADATFAVLKCQAFRSFGHRHGDENNFIIDKRGSLAIESGVDQRSPNTHVRNYFTRTIAHNTVTIKDPEEKTGRAPNDGGQYLGDWLSVRSHKAQHGAYNAGSPLWLNGGIVAFETSGYFDYAVGDATGAYSVHKVEQFTRQVVYLKPDVFVLFDRVVSKQANFEKRWLLHTVNQPVVEGNVTTISESDGKLIVHTLLPRDAALGLVEGFVVDGKNYPPPDPERAFEPGGWRMEVRPGDARRSDVFLHVLYAASAEAVDAPDVRLLDDDTRLGVHVKYAGKTYRVMFGQAGDPAGQIVIREGERVLVDRSFTQTVETQR